MGCVVVQLGVAVAGRQRHGLHAGTLLASLHCGTNSSVMPLLVRVGIAIFMVLWQVPLTSNSTVLGSASKLERCSVLGSASKLERCSVLGSAVLLAVHPVIASGVNAGASNHLSHIVKGQTLIILFPIFCRLYYPIIVVRPTL